MLDTAEFIAEIEKRPAIFDLSSPDYNNKQMREQCWNEIAALVFDNWEQSDEEKKSTYRRELTKRWKDLRDTFVRDIRRSMRRQVERGIKRPSRYVYHKNMEFLIPFIRSTSTDMYFSNQSEKGCMTFEDYMEDEPSTPTSRQDADNEAKYYVDPLEGESELVKGHIPKVEINDDDTSANSTDVNQNQDELEGDYLGNKAFLLSYLPIMNNLPSRLNLEARTKISQIFFDLVNKSHNSAV